MSRSCEICNKKTLTGNNVSHSHRISKRTWAPNVQRIRVIDGATPKRIYVCTRCIRSGKIQKAN